MLTLLTFHFSDNIQSPFGVNFTYRILSPYIEILPFGRGGNVNCYFWDRFCAKILILRLKWEHLKVLIYQKLRSENLAPIGSI